ncbi:MAG TPA: polysaccharide deacetylase family protein [Azospirillaceae bacterium]|nr:polysaccharide deacetylase family protein [Azospirillaceae bacterium]
MMDYAARLCDERIAIFLFHGVITTQTHRVRNYTRKHLTADYFASALRSLLAAGGMPVSLDDLVAAQAAGEPLPPRAFAVTFDDGFWNNLGVAAPILADLRIPATVYVTSGFVEFNRMSWIDRIEWAVEQTPSGNLKLPWSERRFDDDASKRDVLTDIRTHVKSDHRIEPDVLATDIQAQLGLPETWSSDDPLDRKLTWDEVRCLAEDPLFTVGGHTHTHAIMSFLNPADLDREIDTSLSFLRSKAGVGSRHYSYPEGLAHCYSDAVINALKARGVVCCPTAEDGDNDLTADLFRLKRIMAV